MEKKQKYVILADGSVRLSENGIHAYMACTCPEKDCLGRAISAGFWDGEKAFGKSTTLGISSRPEDSRIIKEFLAAPKST